MKIKILHYIAAIAVICLCVLAITGTKQAEASEKVPAGIDIQEIQTVWEKCITGFIHKDINTIMEMLSSDYSSSIDNEEIDYAGYRSLIEKRINDFYTNHFSASLLNTNILESNIDGNKADIVFEYTIEAFNTGSIEWVNYKFSQEVSFSKENGKWKIISSKDNKLLN